MKASRHRQSVDRGMFAPSNDEKKKKGFSVDF